jgi:hypothetical protein
MEGLAADDPNASALISGLSNLGMADRLKVYIAICSRGQIQVLHHPRSSDESAWN